MRHQTGTRFRSPFILGLLLIFALVLAACGEGTTDAETEETTTTTTVVQTTTTTSAPEEEEDHDHDHEDDEHDHEEESDKPSDDEVMELDGPRSLLVVGAFDLPVVDLIDIADGSVISIDLESPAALSSSITESGRFLLAGHGESVTILDTGVWSEPHGDHFHHYAKDPTILGSVEGPMPTHLISHGGVSALYFDGTGSAQLIDEEALESGEVTVIAEVPTSAPHHGFALPTHDEFFVTVPTADMEQLPNVVGISDADGELAAEFDCPATHGEASVADGVAAGCTDGVIYVTEADGTWTGTYLPYPEVVDEDPFGFGPARAWLLNVDSDADLIAAPHGGQHLLIVDPAAESMESFDMGTRIATLGVAFAEDGHVLVLTIDGVLHLVEPDDGSVVSSLEVMAPFEEGDPAQAFKQLAVTGDHIYLTDPDNGQIIEMEVGGDTLTMERTFAVDFTPGFLTIANG